MSGPKQILANAIDELVVANHILAREGVVDALGHVSIRHPEFTDRYLLYCSRSPELVTQDDILEFDLDSNPIEQRGRGIFAERWIHGSVYKARPDINAVCHNHASQVIPFAATATSIKPIWVMGAAIGEEVPVWDIREDFPNESGLLIINAAHGSSMAKRLGGHRCCLLAGHGAVIAETTLKRAVVVSISLMTNAELLMQSRLLTMTQNGRDLRYLSSGEIQIMAELIPAGECDDLSIAFAGWYRARGWWGGRARNETRIPAARLRPERSAQMGRWCDIQSESPRPFMGILGGAGW